MFLQRNQDKVQKNDCVVDGVQFSFKIPRQSHEKIGTYRQCVVIRSVRMCRSILGKAKGPNLNLTTVKMKGCGLYSAAA